MDKNAFTLYFPIHSSKEDTSSAGMNSASTPESDQTLLQYGGSFAQYNRVLWFSGAGTSQPGTGTAASTPHLLEGEGRALPTDLHSQRKALHE